MRMNTERPITLTCGTNTLVGSDREKLLTEIDRILANQYRISTIPELWDGNAARRIVEVLKAEMRIICHNIARQTASTAAARTELSVTLGRN